MIVDNSTYLESNASTASKWSMISVPFLFSDTPKDSMRSRTLSLTSREAAIKTLPPALENVVISSNAMEPSFSAVGAKNTMLS